MGCVGSSESATPPASAAQPGVQTSEVGVEVLDTKNLTPEQLATLTDEEIALIELGNTRFFRRLKKLDLSRDYTVIVDKSASMLTGKRWAEAQSAVSSVVESACKADKDGISLYFFSSNVNTKDGEIPAFNKFVNVSSSDMVMQLFKDPKNQPKGGTDLTSVLIDAVKPDNFDSSKSAKSMKRRPETILCITDGLPDAKAKVEEVIIDAANALESDDQLSITFIQVGDDAAANEWLTHIDDELTTKGTQVKVTKKQHASKVAKFDIVDTIPHSKLASVGFAEIVRKSLQD